MAIRRIDLSSCGNLDKIPIKTLDFDAATMGRSMLLLVWEKIKEAILSAVVYVHYMLSQLIVSYSGHLTHRNTSVWRC